jgi:hypothetical protein
MVQVLLSQLQILKNPNSHECLVVAESAQQAEWYNSPGILSIIFGAVKKEYPFIFSLQIVYGSAYDFILNAKKAELLSINIFKDAQC